MVKVVVVQNLLSFFKVVGVVVVQSLLSIYLKLLLVSSFHSLEISVDRVKDRVLQKED